MRLRVGLLLAVCLIVGVGLWRVAQGPGEGNAGPGSGKLTESILTGPRPDAVFLIIVDTLRADRLSCYGYGGHSTPNIDRLASLGMRFDRAQSVASWTRPSVGAILTSLYPTQLGLVEAPVPQSTVLEWRERRRQLSHILPEDSQTLAEMLKVAGFVTGAFVNQPALNFTNSFQQGFDDWYAPVAPGVIERHDPDQEFRPQEWSSTKYADQSDWALTRKFDEWLEPRAATPNLFAWVHLLTPHMPYRPAPEYAPVVSGEEGDKPSNSELYDGEVRAIDDMIGHLLESIERHVTLERSLIVFTADHGEEFGDHGMFGHGHSLHREVIRVPLIIASGSLPAGRVIENHVRTTDILPTVLDIIGQTSVGPPDMEGETLVPLIAGYEEQLAVYSEAMLYGSSERALIEGQYKLMCDEQEERCKLFAILADPAETSDVAQERPQQLSAMRRRLNELHARLTADYRQRRLRYIDQGGLTEIEQQRALDALRALGYVGD